MAQDDVTPSDPIVHFLNEATLEELTSMNGCSKKKAEVIISERPFADWDDLVSERAVTSCRNQRAPVRRLGHCRILMSYLASPPLAFTGTCEYTLPVSTWKLYMYMSCSF